MSLMEIPVIPCTMVAPELNSHTLCGQQSTSMDSVINFTTEALLEMCR